MMRSTPAGVVPVLAAAALWGTTGTAQAFAPAGAEPASVGAARIAVGGLLLLAVVSLRGQLSLKAGWPPLTTGVAALGVALYQPLFFGGVSMTGVAVGTIAAIGSAPVWAGILGFVFRGERPGGRWVAATFLAVAGCALLVGSGGGMSVDVPGVFLSLGAGLCYAVYATSSKELLQRLPYAAVMAVVFSLGAGLLSPVLLFSDTGWLVQPRGALVALELGVVATAAAYVLFGRGLSVLPVSRAATLSLAEPLVAGLLGVAVLGERLSIAALAGVGLLLVGLALESGSRNGAGD